MGKAVVKFRSKQLLSRVDKAFAKVNEEVLPENFKAEMIESKWAWPSGEATLRRNGQTVTSPRNLVDEGTLIDSYYRQKNGRTQYTHGWSAQHALVSHEGGTLRTGGVIYPRAWTEAPVRFIPQEFAKAFKELDGA